MGITGLLPLLKKATKNSHVRHLSGCTAAIDAYGWLHKGSFGCAVQLGKGEPTTAYISYCMKYIQVLLNNNVKPILVLDGRNLPSKEHTEKKRREKRDENRKLARKYLQQGKKKEAWECFTKCVDITPAMAREFIKELRSKNIDYVVAPYEADAQLAYLAKTGVADVIITEDSDLVLFGCPKIFFKMSVEGDGRLFDSSKLPQCFGLTPKTFRFDHFRWMCILSGCDYLASLPGIGLVRAQKIVQAANHDDIKEMIMTIPKVLDKMQFDITVEYIEGFIQAENTFLYQLVFDTISRTLLPLNPYPENLDPEQLPYAGSYKYEEIATQLALGNVDLHSLKTVDNFEPLQSGYTKTSIWHPSFKPGQTGNVSKVKKEAESVGMELSVSKKSSPQKKRPLRVVSIENDDSLPGDADLMNLYGDKDTKTSRKTNRRNANPVDEEDVKSQNSSHSSNKRRRLADETEEPLPSSNTRSQARKVPFRKSPEKSKVVVKSKYFRSEQVAAPSTKPNGIVKSETNSEELFPEEDDEEDNDDDVICVSSSSSSGTKLSIYSYDSLPNSQDSKYSDITASSQSQHVFIESQQSQITTINEDEKTETVDANAAFKSESVSNKAVKKSEPEEIVLDDDDDEAYESAPSSGGSLSSIKHVRTRSRSASVTLSNSAASRASPYFNSHSSQSPFPSSAARTITTRSSSAKPMTPCRKVGISKNGLVKKDPKQPSVKDMFHKKLRKD